MKVRREALVIAEFRRQTLHLPKIKLECDLSVGPIVIDLHLPKIRPGVIYKWGPPNLFSKNKIFVFSKT